MGLFDAFIDIFTGGNDIKPPGDFGSLGDLFGGFGDIFGTGDFFDTLKGMFVSMEDMVIGTGKLVKVLVESAPKLLHTLIGTINILPKLIDVSTRILDHILNTLNWVMSKENRNKVIAGFSTIIGMWFLKNNPFIAKKINLQRIY